MLALIGLLALLWPRSVIAAPNWYLELPEEIVSETTARRTLALELREVDVPPSPLRPNEASGDVHLHVSVSVAPKSEQSGGAAFLVIEVWDRGEFAGRRRVSARGDPPTVGRRAALAAVELVRQLGMARTRLARVQAKRREERRLEQLRRARQQRAKRLALGSSFSSLVLPEGGWLVGPGLEAEFNSHLPLRLRAALGYRLGRLSVQGMGLGATHSAWSQIDLSVSALWVRSMSDEISVEGGLMAGVSALHLGGELVSEQLTGLKDTWSSRLGGALGAVAPLGTWSRLQAGVSAGITLRRVPYGRAGTESSLGGGFIGVRLALLVRP